MPPRLIVTYTGLVCALLLSLALAVAAPRVSAAPIDSGTAARIDTFLAAHGSPMAGQGAAFVSAGGAWQVDPRLVVAIAGAESSFGRFTCGPFNGWGYGCPNNPYEFSSWADAIDTVTRGLRLNYLAEGRTSVAAIHAKYAPVGADNDPTNLNSAWTSNVSAFLVDLGGDPQNIDLSGVAGTVPIGLPAASAATSWSAAQRAGKQAGQSLALTSDGARLELTMTNTGNVGWTAEQVRLRRIDDNQRVASAPYAVVTGGSVAAGAEATFAIDLKPRGLRGAVVVTRWQAEGPNGAFGDPIERMVHVTLGQLQFGEPQVRAPKQLVVGEQSIVVIKVRNTGTEAWVREGDRAVRLAVRQTSGPSLQTDRWLAPHLPASMLERRVEPAEWGSFAFSVQRARGTQPSVLELAPAAGSEWMTGSPVRLQVEAG